MVYGALIKRLVLSELIPDQYWTTDKLYYARWDAIAMFLPLNLCSVVYCFFLCFSYTVVMLLTFIHIIISIPSTAHSFIPVLKPFYSANHSHCTNFLFLCYQFRCLVNRGTTCVNSSPKTVIRQRRHCNLNPGPSAPESCTLTTRLPSHPCKLRTMSRERVNPIV